MSNLFARDRWLTVSAGVILVLAGHLAAAQSRADIFVGYSYVSSGVHLSGATSHFSLDSTGRAALNGWDVSASVRLARWLRGAADVSAGYGTVPMLFTQLSPFPNQRFNANTNGIDFSLISKLGFRIGADYLRTTLFNQTQNDPRLTAGIVLRF
jgi:hypothetical protein